MLSLIQSNKVLKFAFVLCLCFCLLFVGSFRVNAAATAVGVVAAVALLCLAAWGVSTYATDMNGEDVGEYMEGEVDEWATAAGVSLASVEAGIGQTALGQVVLNPFAAKALRLFAGWYVQQNGIEAGGSSVEVVSSGVTFYGYPVYTEQTVLQGGNPAKVEVVAGPGTYVFCTSSPSYAIQIVSESSDGYVVRKLYNSSGVVTSEKTIYTVTHSSNGVYWNTAWDISYFRSGDPEPVSYTLNDVIGSTDAGVVAGDGSLEMIPSDVIGIPSEEDLENKDVILDFGNLSAIDWYESVQKIFGDVAANDIDVTSQLVEEGAITTTDDVVQKPIVEGAEGVEWPDITQPIGVGGLEDYFPFCLPFDVAHFFEALAADPVAPNFEIPFNVPNLIDYTFEIDLSAFDEAAQIFRTLELFAFIVGLAFVTRNFFIRG